MIAPGRRSKWSAINPAMSSSEILAEKTEIKPRLERERFCSTLVRGDICHGCPYRNVCNFMGIKASFNFDFVVT
jgi:hypothetical protein